MCGCAFVCPETLPDRQLSCLMRLLTEWLHNRTSQEHSVRLTPQTSAVYRHTRTPPHQQRYGYDAYCMYGCKSMLFEIKTALKTRFLCRFGARGNNHVLSSHPTRPRRRQTHFGCADVLHDEILLQGTCSLGEGKSIRGGLRNGGGTQQTDALRKQTHLG